MKYRSLRFFLPSLAVAFLMGSCQVEEVQSPELNEGDENIIPVTVSLKLSVDGETYGTPQTKAIDDPGTVQDTQIKNMVVLQYAGTDDDARLVGDVHYLDSEVTDPEDEHYLGNMEQIKLAFSMHELHTLIFLTNTFTEIRAEETLGAMLRLWREAGGEPDVFGHEGDGHELDPEKDYYQRMNAIAVTEVDNDMTIYGILHRSMARINVQITNSGADGLQIRKVWLRDVSQKDYYITDYSYLNADDHSTVQLLRDYAFQDEYVPAVPMRTDYAERAWTGDNTEGTGTATYRWYVPSNMRGTDDSNLLPEEKNRCPNAVGATYLYILGEYGEDHDQPIIYRFYLGEDLANNFDLKPNTSYSYNFTFNGKGKVDTDKRIEDLGRKDFMVDANTYILNPPPAGINPRKYTINVVHRPNIFWGTSASNDRYGNFSGDPASTSQAYPNNYINETEPWKARILWADFNYDQNAVLTVNNGTGAGTYKSLNQRIELTIPSDINHGNMVIGVWTDDPTNILWSWHIWITDYQPDGIFGHAKAPGAFVYQVEGGEVHRYNTSAFNSGALINGYIMDRNLGALDQEYHAARTRGSGFYYQFGRKDPFPVCPIYIYSYNMSAPSKQQSGNPGGIDRGSTGHNGKNVPYSVNHPMTFIRGDSWTIGDIYNPSSFNGSIVWQDPLRTVRSDNEETGTNVDKSFFDPCPPGWRLGEWCKQTGNASTGEFVGADTSTSSTNANFINNAESTNGHNRGSGGTYYPLKYLTDKMSDQTAFFPNVGYIDTGGGFLTIYSSVYWLSPNPRSTSQGGNTLMWGSGQLSYYTFNGARGAANVLRCVREE